MGAVVDVPRQYCRTFLEVTPSAWKCGARTALVTLSKPLSVALPIMLIGVSLLVLRVFLVFGSCSASLQMC